MVAEVPSHVLSVLTWLSLGKACPFKPLPAHSDDSDASNQGILLEASLSHHPLLLITVKSRLRLQGSASSQLRSMQETLQATGLRCL